MPKSLYEALNETSRLLIYISGALSLVIALLGLILLNDGAPYAAGYEYLALVGKNSSFAPGVFTGFFLAAAKIIMIDRSCKKALEMDANMAKVFVPAAYFSRLFLTGAVFFVAISTPYISFLGTVLGAFSMQLAGYAVTALEKRRAGSGS